MMPVIYVVFTFLLSNAIADDNTKFPDGFSFGAATSAYQIEGAWNEDGKGEGNWDRVAHTIPNFIYHNDSGDVTCDSYHQWEEDIRILKELKVTHYRFSISWPRLLPLGLNLEVNQAGVDYYKNLIKALKAANIEPYVTLFHWDLPQFLEELGGWPNPEIVSWYSEYAKLCFELFGDDVKHWMTFNEPKQTCTNGYGTGVYAPSTKSPGIGEYMCIHNVLRAHAAAYHIYDKEFRFKQNGKVGIVIDSAWWEPYNATTDSDASERLLQFTYGIYANPIFYGDYPDVVKSSVARRSKSQGFPNSRLPEFTTEEKNTIRGTIDFLGLNQYSSFYVTDKTDDKDGMGYDADAEVKTWADESWTQGAADWLNKAPFGIRKMLKWIKKTYPDIPIIITENGWSDFDGTLDDDPRIDYISKYLSNVKAAMDEDKVNVVGYTVWSLLDNLEWLFGFSNKFGLYQVDFNHPNRTRTAKKSAKWYTNVIETRCLGTCE
ncbi:unnamed protein product [Diabrotica balteata]|uniref:Beta-glucosidase n=1 Tax=Diabrotica balteata TaxID=107213 RepID=A0A9N9T392_DIABA|nr:unnamed protein product [Diabrotica balteata]